jgi:hypothetical protein
MQQSPIDYLQIERALSGVLSLDDLNSEEKDFCKKYKPIFEIGKMSGWMARGYYAHKAVIEAARDSRTNSNLVAVGDVMRKDGTRHVYDMRHYLDHGRTDQRMIDELERVWLIGSLIAIGDALAADNIKYFKKKVPMLEFVYHLRNGVAHGNKFTFKTDRVDNHAAHNKLAQVKTTEFEIKRNLQGQNVLFDFMGPADVLDLLQSIEIFFTHSRAAANGRIGQPSLANFASIVPDDTTVTASYSIAWCARIARAKLLRQASSSYSAAAHVGANDINRFP